MKKKIKLKDKLKFAAIAGILNLVFMILYFILEFIRGLPGIPDLIGATTFFIINLLITIFILGTMLIFIFGFVLISEQLKKSFLRIVAYIVIIVNFISIIFNFIIFNILGYNLLTFPISGSSLYTASLFFIPLLAISTLLFGIGLLQIKDYFGKIAVSAGVLELISGLFLIIGVGIITSLVAIFATILEVLILFKAAKKL